MSRETPKNISASVRARLKNLAITNGRPFNELLQHYVIERFLYRLGQSHYADRFVLKGALMLRARQIDTKRPTMDIDMLGRMSNDPIVLAEAISTCLKEQQDDGVEFDASSIRTITIAPEAEYNGIRLTFFASLDKARVLLQLDIGFGDRVVPAPVWLDYPALLEFDPPHLLVYSLETTIAEKFHAMVTRGIGNSRMKDYYDIFFLANSYEFNGRVLSTAIMTAFEQRHTSVPSTSPVGLSSEFANDQIKQMQWTAFLRKAGLTIENTGEQQSLYEVLTRLRTFLVPLCQAISTGNLFEFHWLPGGPWQNVPDES